MKRILIPGFLCLAALQSHAALVAAYSFDETSGTTAADAIRGGTGVASLTAGATFTTGKIGNALTLNGTTGWATAINPVINNQQQLSISAWVNAAALTTWGTIVKDWVDTPTFHFGLDGNSANDNFSNYIGGSGAGSVITSTAITTNTWYHVAFTFNDATDTQNIYLNGLLVGTTTATTGTLATGGGTMFIGQKGDGTSYLNGRIDDLAFYNNELTQSDITTLYNDGLAGISVVPEPSSYGLIGAVSLAGVALVRRRRKLATSVA